MAISLKNPEQIEQMRRAGRIVHEALRRCTEACKPGATTEQVDAQAQALLDETGAMGLFKNYPTYNPGEGFPACTCISINEEVVHGIPGSRVIRDGDIVSIDFGCRVDGWCGDSATTVLVGNVAPNVRTLCQTTEHVLDIARQNIKPGRKWSQVARLMESYAEKAGFGVVKDFVGHGIGRTMHEEPKVPNFVSRDLLANDIELRPGLVMAIEPMCCLGTERVKVLEDGWTVVTTDRQPAAHYEHTIAVTENGCEVLTDGK